ncbi:MAG: hypothetical protein DRI97_15560, partial [Bacteroidetes bacterium]
LYHSKRYDLIQPKLSIVESVIRDSIIEAEEKALLKDSVVYPSKVHRVWDRLWWPIAVENNISLEEAEKLAVSAAFKLSDYCKYDFTNYFHPTISVRAVGEKFLNSSTIFRAKADILKVNIEHNSKNLIIINFSTQPFTHKQLSLDAGIRSLAYAFSLGEPEEIVTYLNVDIRESQKELKITSANFRAPDLEEAKKMLYHLEVGIRKKINYFNPNACGGCNECPDFNFLTKKSSRSK